jgi:glycine cleavage system transcriptional repressor
MSSSNLSESLVITAAGDDQVGLVERFTSRITDVGGNIAESRMVALGGQFAIIVHVGGPWNALAKLENDLGGIGETLGLTISHRRSHGRQHQAAVIPYRVDIVSLDHPGIVHRLSHFFSARAINIEELQTDTYPAPHTGAPMFSVAMTVAVPGEMHIPTLRSDFLDYCDDLNLDATFEPARS